MRIIWISFALLFSHVSSSNVKLLECAPPDEPRFGGYAPRQPSYIPADTIYYYCDTGTEMTGLSYRKCEDSGHWSGSTAMCHKPSPISSTTQTSTAPNGESSNAADANRTTCSRTTGGIGDEWYGNFTIPGEFFKVMIFFGTGAVSYDVILVRTDGKEIVCASRTAKIEMHEWSNHDCYNNDVSGLKIRSNSASPLHICEIAAIVIKSPRCTIDPQLYIPNGYLRLDRKMATLVCNPGYDQSQDITLECVRSNVWNKKRLFCTNSQCSNSTDNEME